MVPDVPHECTSMASVLGDEDCTVVYIDRYREYLLRINDGGTSGLLIGFCPFCGVRLPDSLRSEWFERLDDLGLEPDDPRVPVEMLTGAWWRTAGGTSMAATRGIDTDRATEDDSVAETDIAGRANER